MKNVLILFFSLTLFCATGFSQAPKISWGANIPTKNQVLKIVGETNEGHYALSANKRNDFFVEYFTGQDFSLKFSRELEMEKVDGEKTKFANLFFVDGNLVLLTVAYARSTREYKIYGYNLNENGMPSGGATELMSVNVQKKKLRGQFEVKLSSDKSKMLVFHSAPHRKQEKSWHIRMKVLNGNLQTIKDFEEEIPLKEKYYYVDVTNSFVGNDATLAYSFRTIESNNWHPNMAEEDYAAGDITISYYSPRSGFERKRVEFEMDTKQASSIAFAQAPDGSLLGAGFYSERSKGKIIGYRGLAGIYFVSVNAASGVVETLETSDFVADLSEKILTESQAAKGRLIPNQYYIREMLPLSDGGAILTAEYFTRKVKGGGFMDASVGPGYVQTSPNTEYFYGPVIVVYITPDGKVKWANPITKKQVQVDNAIQAYNNSLFDIGLGNDWALPFRARKLVYYSYLVGLNESTMQFLYNDHRENVEIRHYRKTRKLRGIGKSVPVLVSIDMDGNMTKEILPEGEKHQVVLRPGVSFQKKPGRVLLYGSRKRTDKFGVIEF